MTDETPRPLSAEEEAELRAQPIINRNGSTGRLVDRLLATLDAARAEVTRLAEVHNLTLRAMDDALRASAEPDVETLATLIRGDADAARASAPLDVERNGPLWTAIEDALRVPAIRAQVSAGAAGHATTSILEDVRAALVTDTEEPR